MPAWHHLNVPRVVAEKQIAQQRHADDCQDGARLTRRTPAQKGGTKRGGRCFQSAAIKRA